MMTIWIAIGVLAFASSIAAYYVSTLQIERYTRNRLIDLSEEVARQSGYTLLIRGTPAAEARFKAAFASVSDVSYASLLTADGQVVATVGGVVRGLKGLKRLSSRETIVLKNNSTEVELLTPVFLTSSSGNQLSSQNPLGYVFLVGNKAASHHLALSVAVINILICFVVGFGVIFWALKRTRRVTRPLEQLALTMKRLTDLQAGWGRRAELRGALEYREAAMAFNELMEKIEQQTRELRSYAVQLEDKVSARTEELKAATIAAQAAVRYKNELMASITHEMKAPLYVIGSYSREAAGELEMLKGDTSPIKEFLDVVIKESEQLSEKIKQILDIARVDKGEYTVNRVACDIDAVIRRVYQRMHPLALTNGNQLTISSIKTMTPMDPDLLEQILIAVVTNACKFTSGGKVQLSSTLMGTSLHLTVEDTGCGIAPDMLNEVFEEFRQGDMGETRGFPGTGLGLAIAKRFTELLGGTIQIESELNVGTRVTMIFPIPDRITSDAA